MCEQDDIKGFTGLFIWLAPKNQSGYLPCFGEYKTVSCNP